MRARGRVAAARVGAGGKEERDRKGDGELHQASGAARS
jgi:hypothetical protein